jgi:hypothetical protein
VFDAIAPATAAADVTLGFLFQPERAARMVQQRALDPGLPGLGEVIERVRAGTFGVRPAGPYEAEIGRAVERVFVESLVRLAGTSDVSQVRAIAGAKLREMAAWMAGAGGGAGEDDGAHYVLLAADIGRFLERPYEPQDFRSAPAAPPGSPIGDAGLNWTGTVGEVPDLTCPWDRR